MKYEDLKQELGDLIQDCTIENFIKGYDPIGSVFDNLEIDLDSQDTFEEDPEYCNYQEQQCDKAYYYFEKINDILNNFNNEKKVVEFKKCLIEYLKPKNEEKIEKFLTATYSSSYNIYLMTATLIYAIGEYRMHYWGGNYDELSEHSYKFLMSLFEDED